MKIKRLYWQCHAFRMSKSNQVIHTSVEAVRDEDLHSLAKIYMVLSMVSWKHLSVIGISNWFQKAKKGMKVTLLLTRALIA